VWEWLSTHHTAEEVRAALLAADEALGLGLTVSDEELTRLTAAPQELTLSMLPLEIQILIEKREAARKNKDWAASDSLREEIQKEGYIVKDSANGTQVLRA
jgi:cysteinyl-tRNA synthetase